VTTQPLPIARLLKDGGTLRLTAGGGEDWRGRNEASLEEYREHHQAGAYPPEILEVMAMFEGFVAKWAGIWGAESVVDLGCGIGTAPPPYVRTIGRKLRYVGLDPLEENLERDYPFICGRLEDLAGQSMDKKFDMAMFTTSLDHFENAKNALSLAAGTTDGGRAIIWSGVHDSPLIARHNLSAWIDDLCRKNSTFLKRTAAFWLYAALTWPRVARALSVRERKLAAGKPLDPLHFHYFTENQLKTLLEDAGTVHEFTRCPGSNAVFAAVTLSPSLK
jgi:SAM-dependent methyltransferase